MKYTNLTKNERTFYGVTIAPGETKEVPGHINASGFLLVEETVAKNVVTVHETKKATKQASSNNKPSEMEGKE